MPLIPGSIFLHEPKLRESAGIETKQFTESIARESDDGLVRLRPAALSPRCLLTTDEVVRLFVCGTALGLFDMAWNAVCVFCGAMEYSFDRLGDIPTEGFRCTQCGDDIWSFVDERIEVTFSPSSLLGRVVVDPFRDAATYLRTFSSPQVLLHSEFAAFVARTRRGAAVLSPGGGASVEIGREPARVVSLDRHATLRVQLGGAAREAEVTFDEAGFGCESITVAPGATITVKNTAPSPTGLFVVDGDEERWVHMATTHRATVDPFVTAEQVLMSEAFQTNFGTLEGLRARPLRMGRIVWLLLDLSPGLGSEEDLTAWTRRERAREVVDRRLASPSSARSVSHGDDDVSRVTFQDPLAALRTALDLVEDMERERLGARVCLHIGAGLLVNERGQLRPVGRSLRTTQELLSSPDGLGRVTVRPHTVFASREFASLPQIARELAKASRTA